MKWAENSRSLRFCVQMECCERSFSDVLIPRIFIVISCKVLAVALKCGRSATDARKEKGVCRT